MPDTKLRKRVTSIDFWSSDVNARASRGSAGKRYTGRLVGLIADKEFAALIESDSIQKKCFTSGTIPLADIVDHHEELEGYRVVIALKKIDDEPVLGQRLFITERLSLVSQLNPNKTAKSAGITGESGSYMMIEEELVE